jgi:hypothetical protein
MSSPGRYDFVVRISGRGRAASWRVWAARGVAVAADFLQIVVSPLFGPGAVSPFDDLLDAAVGVVMIVLVGWHWAFLPSFLAELIPGVDLAPTWTIAVLIATRKPLRQDPAGSIETTARPLP